MKMNYVKAVDDVSFYIEKGETLGLVGEPAAERPRWGARSCACTSPRRGKSSLRARTSPMWSMLPYRRKMQIIFQDPYASLNPRMTVGDIIGEALDIHKMYGPKPSAGTRSTPCWTSWG